MSYSKDKHLTAFHPDLAEGCLKNGVIYFLPYNQKLYLNFIYIMELSS